MTESPLTLDRNFWRLRAEAAEALVLRCSEAMQHAKDDPTIWPEGMCAVDALIRERDQLRQLLRVVEAGRKDFLKIDGFSAITFCERHDLPIHKHADPVEGPRSCLSSVEARAVAMEDPTLVYVAAKDLIEAFPHLLLTLPSGEYELKLDGQILRTHGLCVSVRRS